MLTIGRFYCFSSATLFVSLLVFLHTCDIQQDDLQHFARDCALTSLMYNQRKKANGHWNDNEYSVRGLEDTVGRWSSRAETRRAHARCVLDEQRRLQLDGRAHDALALNDISTKSSNKCKLRATAIAKADAGKGYRKSQSFREKVLSNLTAFLHEKT